jgi:hypothetical protein
MTLPRRQRSQQPAAPELLLSVRRAAVVGSADRNLEAAGSVLLIRFGGGTARKRAGATQDRGCRDSLRLRVPVIEGR